MLIPYSKGDSFAVVTVLHGAKATESIDVAVLQTSVSLANQSEVDKKLKAGALIKGDKLTFTALLPAQSENSEPFSALITLCGDADYVTKVEKVESGKPFEAIITANSITASDFSYNIKIFRGDLPVHEYQSAKPDVKLSVTLNGGSYTLSDGEKSVKHTLSGYVSPKPSDGEEYEVVIDYGTGKKSGRITTQGGSFGTEF